MPILLWLAVIVALTLGYWFYNTFSLVGFSCLVFLVAIPAWTLLTSYGLDPLKHDKEWALYVGGISVGIGLLHLMFGAASELGPDARRRVRFERTIVYAENRVHVSECRPVMAGVTDADLAHLPVQYRQRAAIQLARIGDWRRAHATWRSTIVSGQQSYGMQASSHMALIAKKGVSQFSLQRLCYCLYWDNYKKQSVYLWRAYYPAVIPKNFAKPFSEF